MSNHHVPYRAPIKTIGKNHFRIERMKELKRDDFMQKTEHMHTKTKKTQKKKNQTEFRELKVATNCLGKDRRIYSF